MLPTIREIQLVETEMVKIVKDICDKNGLKYYLGYGTLLGAARHKGFIPWDDDADLMMPPEDYIKFIECFKKDAPKGYTLEEPRLNKYCPYPWIKIRKDKTCSMPVAYKNMPVHWGVCIDIFPIYKVRNNAFSKKITELMWRGANGFAGMFYKRYDRNGSSLMRAVCGYPAGLYNFVVRKIMNMLLKRKKGDLYYGGWTYIEKEWLDSKNEFLEFEGEKYRVPSDWDSYLTTNYGDYMTLPPESERGGHELDMGDIIWSIDTSYKFFIN